MIQVVIVSDIRLYRESLAQAIEGKSLINVVGTTFDAKNTLAEISNHSPDVILVDMAMITGYKTVSDILLSYPKTRIIALAMTEDEDSIFACATIGIVGYVSREASLDQLIKTVCGVMRGELHCPRHITASLFKKIKSLQKNIRTEGPKFLNPPSNASQLMLLTQREKQITALLSNGLSNKQIARKLMIEVSTVKNHVHNILTKMNLTSRNQIMAHLQQDLSSKLAPVF